MLLRLHYEVHIYLELLLSSLFISILLLSFKVFVWYYRSSTFHLLVSAYMVFLMGPGFIYFLFNQYRIPKTEQKLYRKEYVVEERTLSWKSEAMCSGPNIPTNHMPLSKLLNHLWASVCLSVKLKNLYLWGLLLVSKDIIAMDVIKSVKCYINVK